ncbi:MED6 mediator subfamily complex component domain containing protein [Naviculisporaceae sp. PSN 640]
MAASGPPLDEIQWKGDAAIMEEFGPYGIHSNTVLFYFKYSPFYDHTSNNEVLFQQGLVNRDMAQFLSTRELFEGRLNTMSGLEFRVAQEPAESTPGKGTGVWVINKQTRQKRQGQEDEITVHSTYFIVGTNVYMAPTMFDIISGRVANIATKVSTMLPLVDAVQTWSPARGRTYIAPIPQDKDKDKPGAKQGPDSTAATTTKNPATSHSANLTSPDGTDEIPDSLILESFFIHEQYGGEYMDENPITGKPGEFVLSSTGRKDPKLPAKPAATAALPALNTKAATQDNTAGTGAGGKTATGKETKSPKVAGMPKPKRRKSKMAVTPS